ncbi:MAG: ABC transporter substrate-binding protein [Sulfobacillus sp.]
MKARGWSLALVPLVLVSVLALAGCGAVAKPVSTAVQFKDDAGAVIKLTAPVTRIVALGPSDTEIVLALGLKKDLVGADAASFQYLPAPYLSQLKGIKNVGNALTTPNLEAIRAAHPGLVLVVYGAPYVAKIKALGIPVAVLDPTSVAGIIADIKDVGLATGDSAGAAALAAKLTSQINAIVQAARASGPAVSTFVELNPPPTLYTVGPGSYIDQLVSLAGGVNVVDKISSSAYPEVSSEQVIAADPQVIILQDQGFGGTVAGVAARPGWSAIAAVKSQRIVSSVNPNLLSNPGPSVVQGLLQLAQALHPGLHVPGIGP